MSEIENVEKRKVYNFIIILINILNKKYIYNDKYKKRILENKNSLEIFNFLIKRNNIFSKIKYKDIFEINNKTNFMLPRDLFDIKKYIPDIIRIPNYLLDSINNELRTKTKSIGLMSTIEKENKKKLIDIFIYQCLNIFQGEIIDIIEKNNNVKKNKYIITSNEKIIVIIIISEKDIEYQNNYGQIIILLYFSYLHNNYNNNVYGIVTSGNNWQWWKYDGKQFYNSDEMTQLRKNNPKSLSILISYIYSLIIEAWTDSFKYNYKFKYLIDEVNIYKTNIYKSKTNEESIKAFNKLKNIISEIKKTNKEYNWNYDINYLN